MKRIRMFSFVLALACILGFYGIAFSGAGEPGGCPDVLPDPTHGPFLYGTFTAAHDKSVCGLSGNPAIAGFDVQMVLRHKLNQVHLFSFFTLEGERSLCDYDASELKEMFAKTPCGYETVGFGYPFGFDLADYTPVIFDLSISKRDCDPARSEEMIFGLITIRLVPRVPPKPPWR